MPVSLGVADAVVAWKAFESIRILESCRLQYDWIKAHGYALNSTDDPPCNLLAIGFPQLPVAPSMDSLMWGVGSEAMILQLSTDFATGSMPLLTRFRTGSK